MARAEYYISFSSVCYQPQINNVSEPAIHRGYWWNIQSMLKQKINMNNNFMGVGHNNMKLIQ